MISLRCKLVLSCLAALSLSGAAYAQTETNPMRSDAFVAHRPWEFGAQVQGGLGLTDDRDSFHFFMLGGHAGKVLTPNIGSGLLRGNFEYGVEVFPLWQSYTPKIQKATCIEGPQANTVECSPLYTVGGTFTGVSITPILLRWNFTGSKRVSYWAQGGGGVIWTNHKYPAFGSSELNLNNDGPSANTSVWNFTPQFGVGLHYFVRPRRSIDFGANAVHISSASLGDKNPGVNASVQLSVGYTWWK
ncbi:MAG TPA: acyloxyacyl hydrolase [Granulicella sp.]